MSFHANIRGLQEAQAAALRAIAALKPTGALGRAVRYVVLAAHRFATANTPVDTGSWRASHRPQVQGTTGRIFLDPAALNPKSHSHPAVYGPVLELTRKGRYAVYARTVNEAGPEILAQGGQIIEEALP